MWEMCLSNISKCHFRESPSLVAFLLEVLSEPKDLSNQARALELSILPLGNTPNRKFSGIPSKSLNPLSWRFLTLKMVAESREVLSTQMQQITVANFRNPSYSVWPLSVCRFNCGRSAGKSLPFSSHRWWIISTTQRDDCAWPITKPISSVLYVFSASILCSVTKTRSLNYTVSKFNINTLTLLSSIHRQRKAWLLGNSPLIHIMHEYGQAANSIVTLFRGGVCTNSSGPVLANYCI